MDLDHKYLCGVAETILPLSCLRVYHHYDMPDSPCPVNEPTNTLVGNNQPACHKLKESAKQEYFIHEGWSETK